MNFDFLRYKKYFFLLSVFLILGSLASLFVFGLKFGVEFTGGSILEIEYLEERPSNIEITQELADFDLGETIQPAGEKRVIIRMREIDEKTHQEIFQRLKEKKELEEKRFESIGPMISRELRDKTTTILILASLAILSYIALAFRKVSYPIAGWQYGIGSVLAIFHDLLITLGVFSLLGFFYNVEITIPIIIALLAIVGHSIDDTIVVFDRIRENLFFDRKKTFNEIINKSLNQAFKPIMSTTFTTLLIITSLFIFGGETLKYFSLALIVGFLAGAYSSIFLIIPLFGNLARWKEKR